jgi:hypothetical protein
MLACTFDLILEKQVAAILSRDGLRRNMESVVEAAGAMKLDVREPQDRPWLHYDQLDQMHRLRNEVSSHGIRVANLPI